MNEKDTVNTKKNTIIIFRWLLIVLSIILIILCFLNTASNDVMWQDYEIIPKLYRSNLYIFAAVICVSSSVIISLITLLKREYEHKYYSMKTYNKFVATTIVLITIITSCCIYGCISLIRLAFATDVLDKLDILMAFNNCNTIFSATIVITSGFSGILSYNLYKRKKEVLNDTANNEPTE